MRKIIIILGLIPILLGLSSNLVSETTERSELPLDHGYDFLVYPEKAGGLLNGRIITLYPGSRIMMIGDLVFPWDRLTCKDGRGSMSMGTYTLHGDSLIFTPRYEFVHSINGSRDTSYILPIGACNPPGGIDDKWIYRFKVDSIKQIDIVSSLIRSIEEDTVEQYIKDFTINQAKLFLYQDTSESYGYVYRYVGQTVDRKGQSQAIDKSFQPVPVPTSYSDIPMRGIERLDENLVLERMLQIQDQAALYGEESDRPGWTVLWYLARGRFDYAGNRFYILDIHSNNTSETRTYLLSYGDKGGYPRALLIFDGEKDTIPDGRNNRVNFTIEDGVITLRWWNPAAKNESQCTKSFPLNSEFKWK